MFILLCFHTFHFYYNGHIQPYFHYVFTGSKPNETLMKGASDCVALGLLSNHLQEKLLFFYKTSDSIEYLSHYETNAPGRSNSKHFSDIDVSKYEKTRKEDNSSSEHINAGMNTSSTDK